jgi:hypothetical protein
MPSYGKIEGMTTFLEEVVGDVCALPDDEQDRVARALLAFLNGLQDAVVVWKLPRRVAEKGPRAVSRAQIDRSALLAAPLLIKFLIEVLRIVRAAVIIVFGGDGRTGDAGEERKSEQTCDELLHDPSPYLLRRFCARLMRYKRRTL